MAAIVVDSLIFRDIFSTEEMRRIFSDASRVQWYLNIEAALAKVQARLDIIPQTAADEIVAHCHVEQLDLSTLKTQTEFIGYPVLPVVHQLVALCSKQAGQYCHWGATTQDITFGYKVATWLSAIERHRQRLRELRPRVLVGEFGGAAGTLASLLTNGLRVQAGLMAELGLGQPEIAWHTQRDRIAEVACFLGLVTGTLGKIETDVKLLMQTEVGEVLEPYASGRGSSSTMPQKRNPISCNFIHACMSMVCQHVAALLDAMVEDHERATGPWEIEWIALPEIFRMQASLERTRDLICTEAVMMALAPHLGREKAHDLIYALSQQSVNSNQPLLDLLARNEEVREVCDRDALAQLLDPANYLGLSGEMVDRVLAQRTANADAKP